METRLKDIEKQPMAKKDTVMTSDLFVAFVYQYIPAGPFTKTSVLPLSTLIDIYIMFFSSTGMFKVFDDNIYWTNNRYVSINSTKSYFPSSKTYNSYCILLSSIFIPNAVLLQNHYQR